MVLVILGLVAGLAAIGQRLVLEKDFQTVEIAVDLRDLMEQSSRLEGLTDLNDLLQELGSWGVESLVLTVSPQEPGADWEIRQMAETVKAAGYRLILKIGNDEDQHLSGGQMPKQIAVAPDLAPSAADLASFVYMTDPEVILFGGTEVAGYPGELRQVADLLRAQGIRFGLQEFAGQQGEAELAKLAPLHTVRVHTIYPKELPRYDRPRTETRFLRAVRERSYRLLYVRSLPEDELSTTASLVKGIDASLQAAGYDKGSASSLPPWQTGMAIFLLAICGWLGASLVLWTAVQQTAVEGRFLRSVVRWGNGLAIAGISGFAVLMLVLYMYYDELLARQMLAFLVAITFPTWALLPQRWSGGTDSESAGTRGRVLAYSVWRFAVAAGISLAGAAIIVAALGDYRFMLKIAQFRGVKVMSLLPVALVGIGAILQSLQIGEPLDWRKQWRNTSGWLRACLLLLAVTAVVIYVGRTGNFVIPVPTLEVRLREFLEDVFPYRPRTKELFIGHPLLILGLGLYGWGWRRVGLWMGVLGTIGQASMINTFTHIHSSLVSSISRTVIGLLLGAGLGCILLYFALLVLGKSPIRPSGTGTLPTGRRPT